MILGEGRDDIVRGVDNLWLGISCDLLDYCPAGVVLFSGLPGFSGSTDLEVTAADVFTQGQKVG